MFYLYCIQEHITAFEVPTLLSTLPASRRTRIERRPCADRIASAAAAHLLRYALCDSGYAAYADAPIVWEGKPHFADPAISVHFNLSHTVDKTGGRFAVVVLLSDTDAVGVDVEFVHPIHNREAMMRRLFTDAERDYVLSSEREDAFFEIWCAKEAYLKWTGEGFYRPMSSVSVDLVSKTAESEDLFCNLCWLSLGDCTVCTAGKMPSEDIFAVSVTVEDIIKTIT